MLPNPAGSHMRFFLTPDYSTEGIQTAENRSTFTNWGTGVSNFLAERTWDPWVRYGCLSLTGLADGNFWSLNSTLARVAAFSRVLKERTILFPLDWLP